MIQLYARDATVVVDVLRMVADLHDALFEATPVRTRANQVLVELEAWAPSETPTKASSDRKHQIVAERLRAVIAAIEEQRGGKA
jgi:hypothetical protein